jgi:ABC-2 type transport system ATP-binding protein
MLKFNNVSKTYRIAAGGPGFGAAVKRLFFPAYTYIKAVQNLSFTINRGELVGLIGENGAGKSTIVKIATGILRPDKGQACLADLDVSKYRKKCALQYGVTFGQRRSLWWQLSAREGFLALAKVYNIHSSEIKNRTDQLIDLFELGDFVDRPVRQLSLGQRIRCEVAGCFIHRPQIVFLDEPTIGMDALAKIKMREYLKKINHEDGVSILLTSHDLFDVERVCNRILVLDKGVLILDDTFDSLRRKYCTERMLTLNLAASATDVMLKDIEGIEPIPGGDKWKLNIRFNPVERPVLKLMEDLQKRLDIVDFTVEDLPVDEFVAKIYKNQSDA